MPASFFSGEANEVGVLSVEFVHQPLRWRALVLRDFLHERFVVQPMDLFKLPVFGSEFKNERLP